MDIERLKRLAELARIIVDSNMDWEDKYDRFFGGINVSVREAGLNFDYYDPDSSYEDDVLAYNNAFQQAFNEAIENYAY